MSKKQWKTIDLSLQFSTKSDWSLEENDTQQSDVNSIRSIRSALPTKTNATRQTAELDNISENGPFILNYANMSFDATESDLMQFFRAYQIVNIEVNNPRRGCGYIEFTNINDLAGAWKLNEKVFINRPLRLSIPLKDDILRQQQTSGTKQKYPSNTKSSTFDMDDGANWRTKKSQPTSNNDSITNNKEDDQSNWRTRSSRDTLSTVGIVIPEESNWRNRAPAATSKDPTEPENTAWRKAAPASTTADISKPEETNWRNRAPVEAPTYNVTPVESVWKTRPQRATTEMDSVVPDNSAWRKVAPREAHEPTSVTETINRRNINREPEDAGDNWRIKRSVNEESTNTKKQPMSNVPKPVDSMPKEIKVETVMENKNAFIEGPWRVNKSVVAESHKNGKNESTKVEPSAVAPPKAILARPANAWKERQQSNAPTPTPVTVSVIVPAVEAPKPTIDPKSIGNAWTRGAPKVSTTTNAE